MNQRFFAELALAQLMYYSPKYFTPFAKSDYQIRSIVLKLGLSYHERIWVHLQYGLMRSARLIVSSSMRKYRTIVIVAGVRMIQGWIRPMP